MLSLGAHRRFVVRSCKGIVERRWDLSQPRIPGGRSSDLRHFHGEPELES